MKFENEVCESIMPLFVFQFYFFIHDVAATRFFWFGFQVKGDSEDAISSFRWEEYLIQANGLTFGNLGYHPSLLLLFQTWCPMDVHVKA